MNKELKNPRHVAHLPKFGHDMSQILKFSSCTGHLLPVYYDDLQPGDKVRYSTDMFTQMTDVVGPAMVDLEEFVEWFFVPYSQLYQFANDNNYSISDSHTSYRPTLSEPSVFPMIEKELLYTFDYNGELIGEIFHAEDGNTMETAWSLPSDVQRNYNYDIHGVPVIYNSVRLFDLLGFGDGYMAHDGEVVYQETFNPRFLLAYQKIFYDVYRISDRIPNDVQAYNVDDLSGFTSAHDVQQGRTDKWKEIHYRPWKKDFFTNLFVAPLIDVGSIGMQSDATGNRLEKFNNWLSLGTARNDNGAGEKNLSIGSTSAGTNVMSTALMRGMFAVEKLMEITRRAAKRYDAQVLAHLGFDVPEGISNEVYRLGVDKNQIIFKEVVATAAGTASNNGGNSSTTLGEKGGKGAGYNGKNKQKSFVAPCHGILMAIYSAAPSADYDSRLTDRLNTYSTRYDFFQPELDRLGMQPLFRYQICPWDFNDDADNFGIVGWQYRYMEQKMKYNKATGAFLYNAPYKYWTVYRNSSVFQNNIYPGSEIAVPFFYVGVNAIDNILAVHSQPSYKTDYILDDQSSVYQRDSMLHWFRFNVFKSSRMSNYSLPNL